MCVCLHVDVFAVQVSASLCLHVGQYACIGMYSVISTYIRILHD